MHFDKITSAWRGHESFAAWLVHQVQPRVIVDLGVDFGFSTIALARPNIGMVYGVDWFKGDSCAGYRDTEQECRQNLAESGVTNVEIIRSDFSALAARWSLPIDILHIDGDHAYPNVQRDFDEWSMHVLRGGVIMLHDTKSFAGSVGRLFAEVPWPKFEFPHSHGLGVIYRER